VLRREGRHLTSRRYSAGYADFVLENQAIFFRELELEKLGVQLTASFILVPEKSVTAIAGIEKTS
jgi:cobalamin-dependent methionine synthase I